jgi:Mn2+/Fe2+ NRAMP family transporter
VVNGVVAVPVMVVMMLMTANKKMMGRFVVRGYLRIVGWLPQASWRSQQLSCVQVASFRALFVARPPQEPLS